MRKARLLFACAGMLIAGGCASTAVPTTARAVDDDTDYQKMQLVDQWAMRNNVTVVWVNRPTRKTPAVVNQ